ncbi:hypothetical protein KC968_04480 [Candidatus Saccharibacteria bacterium]|nr:hypothetical protein [Candidatus Saccharibacteria bacterium]
MFYEQERQLFSADQGHDRVILPVEERALTEVDHLLAARTQDGLYPDHVVEAVRQNLVTAVQEAAMPYAVTTTKHEVNEDEERGQRTFRWLGKTAVQTAMSGYRYHSHPNALKRVDVEVAEARFASEMLRPGIAQVFISPRMSRKDATLEEARREHLGDDDAVRVSWIDNSRGKPERVMQSLLVRDIPLQAWVEMLADSSNVFGKSIIVDDKESALSVMKVFSQLEISANMLPKGPVTILEEVVGYIKNDSTRRKVTEQISKYYGDQELMRRQAEFKAEQWLQFEYELADSLVQGTPTSAIKSFIASMQHVWNSDELRVINQHSSGNNLEYMMTRELACILEKAKQNTLWGGAAVLSGNEAVVKQLQQEVCAQIQSNEQAMFVAYRQGQDLSLLQQQNSQLIGGANIKVGGGCAGNSDRSATNDPANLTDLLEQRGLNSSPSKSDDWESNPNSRKWKKGVCQVRSCSTRPGVTEVGPCSVCKSCQAKFDAGDDPTKYVVPPRTQRQTDQTSQMSEDYVRKMIDDIFASTQNHVERNDKKEARKQLVAV